MTDVGAQLIVQLVENKIMESEENAPTCLLNVSSSHHWPEEMTSFWSLDSW